MSGDDRERVVKLFVRADPEVGAEGAKSSAVDRLTSLEREGAIDRFDCVAWGSTFRPEGPLEGTDYHAQIRETIDAVEEWASTNGASVEATFRRQEVDCAFTGETYEVVSLPTLCLAEYREGELDGVYPCHDGDRLCPVADFFDELDERRNAADAAVRAES